MARGRDATSSSGRPTLSQSSSSGLSGTSQAELGRPARSPEPGQPSGGSTARMRGGSAVNVTTGRLGPLAGSCHLFDYTHWHNRASQERGLGIDAGDDSVVAFLLCPDLSCRASAPPHATTSRPGMMSVHDVRQPARRTAADLPPRRPRRRAPRRRRRCRRSPGQPDVVAGLGHLAERSLGRRRRPDRRTRSPGSATTAGSTPCAATAGRATARSRGSTSPTRASCAAWPRSRRRRRRSAKPTRPSAAATFLTDSDPNAPHL